ncbi:ParB/RepB/Spo0J family partition protein [Sulfuricurvum sp.]|uniref:ParB/RepB/Spo0J family partition protein n=1 Tax=Sulfuricurvum sp. TaxID=2025608 RepID=UPI002E2F1621|nr:ParB/RepB/Spo0J family partition protein [Sulfuricurvum sp.]HEX5328865.1 ParB/RepB/Spo0J family partition protein [Sulfuricurvum sp.]
MKINAINDAVTKSKPNTNSINNGSVELELSQVYANPNQPRKHFDPVALAELAEAIKTHGLLQPISVVRRPDGYMIIAGERRYRAHQINESITIKVNILEREDHTVEELALIENIQREDLSDYEIAMAVVRLWESGKYKQKQELAGAIKKPLSYISKSFACMKLSPEIKHDIEQNKSGISLSVMQELSRVEDPQKQREIYQKYNAGEIKRDEFKEAAKPKAEKISRGKKQHIIFPELIGETVPIYTASYIQSVLKVTPNKKYKITIEEVE